MEENKNVNDYFRDHKLQNKKKLMEGDEETVKR